MSITKFSETMKSKNTGRLFVFFSKLLLSLFIVCNGTFQILLNFIKAKLSLFECLFTICLGIWLAFYLFCFTRGPIQRHIRLLLEYRSNSEFIIVDRIAQKKLVFKYNIIASVVWVLLSGGIELFSQHWWNMGSEGSFAI